eukprot:GILJ01002775.1.p1 GENE.GILJ01002775.1~~GILJ01002775.1.p1  ORF type:complete len:254 (-),score=33.38 GILJ01002775.1:675-1436(-)
MSTTRRVSNGRRRRTASRASSAWQWNKENSGVDGSLLLQERIHLALRADSENIAAIVDLPAGVDSLCWQYEHIRQTVADASALVVKLRAVCTPQDCPKMVATDSWHFLCAAHKEPKECCAIDYCLHTLENTTVLLNNPVAFPCRSSIPHESLFYFPNIVRRLYRIFAHAFFHHREQFDLMESNTHMCERFTYFLMKFGLMQSKLLLIPVEAFSAQPHSFLNSSYGGGAVGQTVSSQGLLSPPAKPRCLIPDLK